MERNKKARWTEQEIKLLRVLYPHLGSKKWKMMAQEMRRQGFNRTEIEIRQRWVNFEDPSVNKSRWEEAQLARMYDILDQVGTKWCLIQKYIGRTQNMIKNRFYGTLRNYIRFLLAHFSPHGQSYNRSISKLSPTVLNDIYKSEQEFRFLGEDVKEAICQMGFKIDKKALTERFKEKAELYERLKFIVCRIFSEFNSDSKEKYSEKRRTRDVDEEFERKEDEMEEQESQEEQEEQGEEVEKEEEKEKSLGYVKAESEDQVYPFLQKEASQLIFKVHNEAFYPFFGQGSFEIFQNTYFPHPTHFSLH